MVADRGQNLENQIHEIQNPVSDGPCTIKHTNAQTELTITFHSAIS